MSSEIPRWNFDPQLGLKGLPFVRQYSNQIGGVSCFWCAPSTGDQNLDFELGSLYGLALLKYLREVRRGDKRGDVDPGDDPAGEFTDLFQIVGAMIGRRRADDIESGFLSELERYLVHSVRPEGGWADPTAELDGREWVWFSAECRRIWSAAPLRAQVDDVCCTR